MTLPTSSAIWASTDAQAVVTRGRTLQLLQVSYLTCLFVILGIGAVVDDSRAGIAVSAEPATLALIVIAGLLLLMSCVRGAALCAGRRDPVDGAQLPPTQARLPHLPPGSTVICCSGGGIKSASFCLGALQRLDLAVPDSASAESDSVTSVYQRAALVVGVSGGGYMATAFAAARWRAANEGRDPHVFAPGSRELGDLRRRTNYLASSAQVRYFLVLSLLVGIVANLVLLAVTVVGVGWLAAQHATAVGVVRAGSHRPAWSPAAPGPLVLLLPSIALILLSVLLFCIGWLWAPKSLPPLIARLRLSAAGSSPQGRVLARSVGNAPTTFALLAVALMLVYPGIPWTAAHLHALAPVWLRLRGVQLGGAGGFIAMVAALTKSTVKGARAPRNDQVNAVLAYVRRSLAPVTAICLLALGCYLGAVFWADWVVLHAGRHPARSTWAAVAAGLLVLAGFRSANLTSLFGFYRRRLAAGYLHGTDESGAFPAFAQVAGPKTVDGGPGLALCATANVTDADRLPTGRGGMSFVMTDVIGLSDGNLAPGGLTPAESYTVEYLPGDGFDVSAAMALSGAAIAPVAGRETRMIGPARLLLALFNIRLGLWVPNPYWMGLPAPDGRAARAVLLLNHWLNRPTAFHVVQEALTGLSASAPNLYVTDGGHYDNLGLVEALRRHPTRIIMLDGSGDAEDQFPTMGDAMATARMDLDVQIEFDPSPMQRQGRRHQRPPRTGWVRATARYPDGTPCHIDYLKCVLPAGLPWDLQAYALSHPGFPAAGSSLEMFDEFDFEAFRQLGYALTDRAQACGWAPR